MKNKYFSRITSVLLTVLITFSIFTVNVSASNTNSEIESIANKSISWKDKISDKVLDEIKSADKEEKFPVWIWFSDINQDEVDRKVKKDTGLTSDNISVNYEEVPEDLIKELNKVSDSSSNSKKKDVAKKIEAYVNLNKTNLEKEKYIANTYVRTKRKIARDFYEKNNTKIIKTLNIPDSEIEFQSQLTPSVVVNLTEKQIKTIAKSDDVVSIDYYNNSEQQPPMYEAFKTTMRVDKAKEQYGLTGEGVNVLMNDHGCVRSDYGYYNNILKPENIVSIVNGEICSITDTSVPCGSVQTTHPNLIAGAMQEFAEDVNIFSTGYRSFADVEWALLNCNIDLINGSVNYGTQTNYANDSEAKWFDAIVSTYDVALIASAGNSQSWQQHGWPNVISPSSGYNSIAVGAYSSNGTSSEQDTMHDYRYNPTTSTNQACYKPDVVIASYDTSRSSPNLSGIIAMMIQFKPSLAAHPELIKAILMASCHRKVKPATGTSQENIFDGLTQRQGAGAVDAYRAISIVMQGNYGINEITQGTTDIDFIQPADGNNINVSLAWLRENNNNSNTFDSGTTLGTLQELQMKVYQGSTLMGESTKTNAGKQMVYFSQMKNTDQYTIRVTKASDNNETVQFAYAWSTDETAGKHLTLSTNNASGIISQEEVAQQITNSGIVSNQSIVPFTVSFDDTVSSIGNNAFNSYDGLISVTIPNNVTSIGQNAFANNHSLKSVIIGDSVNLIEQNAFSSCTDLAYVYFHPLIAPNIENGAFNGIANGAKGYIKYDCTGYLESYDDLYITRDDDSEDIRTIYFTNNHVWNNLKAYLWKDGSSKNNSWPGVPMKYAYTNYLGQGVFSITVDVKQYDMIIFNDADSANQTVDINIGADGTGYYLSDTQTNGKWNVSTFTPDVRTIYFTNNYVWSNLKVYLWKNGTSQNNNWPGVSMIYASTNDLGQGVFSITFDYNEYDRVVFNDGNGQAQTVDISIGESGVGYYLTGVQSNGKWLVNTYIY